jgi:hypothetical protein
MGAHAILSPSGAHRWLSCTPSARLEEQFPDKAGEAAEEGTLAHKLGELLLRYKLKQITKAVYAKEVKEIETHKLFHHSMHEHADAYAVFVLERYAEAQTHTRDALIYLEHLLNLSDYIPEGFGTGDTVIIADTVMDLIDLKYGKGVLVSAENNKQLKLYALGALRDFDFLYDIKTVRMTIFQPRIDNYSTWEIEVEELRRWAEEELKPRAEMAFKGEGEFNPGSHCQFCKAKAVCKANAEYNLQLAKHDFADPNLLEDDDISNILTRAAEFKNWLGAVEDYALDEAVNNGKKWPGFKLVEGRSNRQYVNEDKVAGTLMAAGFARDLIYKKPSLLGITDMEKAIGKKGFGEYLKDLVIKPAGKPTLVPQTDKRPEYNSAEAAKADFAEI